MKKSKIVAIVAVIMVFVVGIAIATMFHDEGTTSVGMSQDEAYSKLLSLSKRVDYRTVKVQPEQLNVAEFLSTEEELPDIDSTYPMVVVGSGNSNVEIFSSGEKAAKTGNDSFLTEMAEKFNKSGAKTKSGKSMSVSLRSVPSGTSVDYIASGKYVPDCYTPSSALYKEVLDNEGIEVRVISERLVGNVAGVIINNKKYEKLYGDKDIDITDIVKSVSDGELAMGYSNPYTSATGLNFLLTALRTYDSDNLLSNQAVDAFEAFQAKIPLVSYTTQQLITSGEKGIIDAMVCEYQSYDNNPTLSRNYRFLPFGMRHDNPLFAVKELSTDQLETAQAFAEYCEKNESVATADGFNKFEEYQNEDTYVGDQIAQAQSIYKEVKSSSKTIVAEFIVDISGSMDGEPINNLKKAMLNTMQYIDDTNQIGVMAFDSRVYDLLPIGEFDLEQKTLFKGAVNLLDAGGQTYMYEALMCGLKNVKEKCDELGAEAKPIIFVLTDGEANGDLSYPKCEEIIDGMDIPVYTISYNYKNDILGKISDLNEGAYISGSSDDIIYKLKQLFNSEM